MPEKHYLAWFSVPIVLLLFALLWLVWSLGLPWAANTYGFALPGPGGLPNRVFYAGQGYSNPATCARAGWCNAAPYGPLNPLCWKVKNVQGLHAWPLVQVGTVNEFLGSPMPLLAARAGVVSGHRMTMVFVGLANGCYVPYSLNGS